MRKVLYCAIVAASALGIASPVASAQTASVHVLTIRTAAGPAVKAHAVLRVGLAHGTTAVFSLGSEMLTCKSLRFTAKVTSNPARTGTARESLTTEKVSKCKTNVKGVTVSSVKVSNLPFNVTVSDAAGLPVKVSGRSGTKPIRVTVVAKLGSVSLPCSYRRASLTGHASNTGNVISFAGLTFVKAAGSSFCPASALFTATFGPVRDVSVAGSPKVFVN